MDLSTGKHIHETASGFAQLPVPIGTGADRTRRWRRSTATRRGTDREIFRDTLVEQAEQGVDYFTIHAGVRCYIRSPRTRVTGIVLRGGSIDGEVVPRPTSENFLRNDEFCEIMKAYDVAFARRRPAPRLHRRRQRRRSSSANRRPLGELTKDRLEARRRP